MQTNSERKQMYEEASRIYQYILQYSIKTSDELIKTLENINSEQDKLKKIKANIKTIIEYNNIKSQYYINEIIQDTKNYYTIVQWGKILWRLDLNKKNKFIIKIKEKYEIVARSMISDINIIKNKINKLKDLLNGYWINFELHASEEAKKLDIFSKWDKKQLQSKVQEIYDLLQEKSLIDKKVTNEKNAYKNNNGFIQYLYTALVIFENAMQEKIREINQAFLTIDWRIYNVE